LTNRKKSAARPAEKVRQNLRFFVNRHAALTAVRDEVSDFRTNVAPNTLRGMKTRNASSGFEEKDWQPFLLNYSGDVDGVIRPKAAAAEKSANSWRGVKPTAAVTVDGAFIADDADLERQPLAVLEAERKSGFRNSYRQTRIYRTDWQPCRARSSRKAPH
jgi:uncharacterized protein with gpF-like domain